MPQTICIACTVFRPELEELRKRGLIDFPIRYLDSNLHMAPAKLHEHLVALLENELNLGHQVLLVYGDCHAHMVDLVASPKVTRVQGVHCGEILLGREQSRRLRKEKAFYMFPEWAQRWREILGTFLDLDRESTIEIMREEHSKLVYLDTGICPVPEQELKACSEYFGFPYEVLSVSLDHFLGVIYDAIREMKDGGKWL